MRVLVIAHRVPYPPNKGEKLRTYYQLEYLRSKGVELVVAAPYETPQELAYFSQLEQQLALSAIAAPLPSKLVRYATGLVKGQSLSEANFYSKALQQKLNTAIAEQTFDAILCTASSMAVYCKNTNIKKLMDFMDVDSDKWGQYQQRARWPMSWVYRREQHKIGQLEQTIQQRFDHCYLISQKEVDVFALQTPVNNVKPLANGIDFNEFYPAPSGLRNTISKSPQFLFVGVMDYKPNVDAMLWFVERIWPAVIKRHPDAQLSIVGMNPVASIQALANQPGVVVTGMVDSVVPYFHQSDIFIAPFLMARGVQNKVLQAFSCGLPVVCTAMGAEGIACHDQQHYLQANTSDEFIQALEQLIQQPSLRHALGKAAYELMQQQYSWQGCLKPLADDLGISPDATM